MAKAYYKIPQQREGCFFADVCQNAPESCGECLNWRSGATLKDELDGEKTTGKDKGIVITASGCWFEQEFDEPLYKSVGRAVGGYIEIVHPRGLASPYVLVVNEEGMYNLPVNMFGSLLYGIMAHGCPIYGNAVIMKEGFRNGEPDVVGLSKRDLLTLGDKLKAMHLKEVKAKGAAYDRH